jgi:SAM-dependent methyltransferase
MTEPTTSPTARYYQDNASAYFERTRTALVTALYDRFLAHVSPGGHILDAGCGSGRDLWAFVQKGYQGTGIDASAALVALARNHSGTPCRVRAMQDLDETSGFDGIWACASLMHLDRAELVPVLNKFHTALKAQGALYVSVKEGQGDVTAPDGRYFALYRSSEMEHILEQAGFHVKQFWLSNSVLPGDQTVWLNYVAVKG